MVIYLSSQATTTINVISAEVGTVLTISAPAEMVQGQPFIIEGQLTRVDTGAPLLGETIELSFNGTSFPPTITRDIGGSIKYETTVQIDSVGSYTLTADFTGSTRPGLTLRPTTGIWNVAVSQGMNQPLIIGAVATLGVLLLAVGLSSK